MNQHVRILQRYGLYAIDMLSIIVSYWLATMIRYASRNDLNSRAIHWAVCVVLLLFCTFYSYLADWNHDFLKRGYFKEFTTVVRYMAFMMAVVIVFIFAAHWFLYISRTVIFHFTWINLLLTYCLHLLYRRFLHKRLTGEALASRMIVVAQQDKLAETIHTLTDRKDATYRIVGAAYANSVAAPGETIDGIPIYSGYRNLTENMVQVPFDEAFINAPDVPVETIAEFIRGFEDMGVDCHYSLKTPGSGEALTRLHNFMGYNVVTYTMNRSSYKWLLVKRFFDIIGGLVGLALTGIIFLFLAPAIKIDSPGPVFFSQTRVGKNGRRFRIYKFRSMYRDAEARLQDLMKDNEVKGLMFKMEDDPRVTKVGKFIRKTSLDEFPQFLNVLKGDMSLVGTRPPTEKEFEQYNEHYRRRLMMTPGLTGMWQVSGRSDITDFDEVVKLDLYYIDHWSLGLDLKILFQTVAVVFGGKGAK